MKRGFIAIVVAIAGYGCAKTETSVCDNGRICPAGQMCSQGGRSCGTPLAVIACEVANDGDSCELEGLPAVCSLGVCGRGVCGDGLVVGAEECDPAAPVGDCVDYGFGFGVPSCSMDCKLDTTECGDFEPRILYENPSNGTYTHLERSDGGRIYAAQAVDGATASSNSLSVFSDATWQELSLSEKALDIALSVESAYVIFANEVRLYDGVELLETIPLPDAQTVDLVGTVPASGVLWVTDSERVWFLAGEMFEESANLPDSGPYQVFSYDETLYLASELAVYSALDDGSWLRQVRYPEGREVVAAIFNGTYFYLALSGSAGVPSEILLMEPMSSTASSSLPGNSISSNFEFKRAKNGIVYTRSFSRVFKLGDLPVQISEAAGAFAPEENGVLVADRLVTRLSHFVEDVDVDTGELPVNNSISVNSSGSLQCVAQGSYYLHVPGQGDITRAAGLQINRPTPYGWVRPNNSAYVPTADYAPCFRVGGSCDDIFLNLAVDGISALDTNHDRALAVGEIGYVVTSGADVEFIGYGSFTIGAASVLESGPIVVTDGSAQAYLIHSDRTTVAIEPALPDVAVDMKAFSTTEIYVATSTEIIQRSGESWKSLGTFPFEIFSPQQLEGTSGDDLWVIGQDGSFERRLIHWDGASWSKVEMGAEPNSMSVAGGVIGVIFEQINGASGRVFHRLNF